MKRFFILSSITILLCSLQLSALPNFWYSGVAYNSMGQIVANGSLEVNVTVTDGSSTYVENFLSGGTGPIPSDAFGVVSVNVGTGTIVSGILSSVSMTASTKITVKVRPVGGSVWVTIVGAPLSTTYVNQYVNIGSISLDDGHILIGDVNNQAQEQVVSGDATISNTGVLAIGANKILTGMIKDGEIINADINSNAAISVSKLAAGTNTYILTTTGATNVWTDPSTITVGTANKVTHTLNSGPGINTFTWDGSSNQTVSIDFNRINNWAGLQTFSAGEDVTGTFALDGIQGALNQVMIGQGSGNTPIWSSVAGLMNDLTVGAGLAMTPGTAYDGSSAQTISIPTGGVTNAMLAGSISNDKLVNNSITINGTSVALGGTRNLVLASADYANQGTTTGVLHGNAAGNPSWGQIVPGDVSAGLYNINISGNAATVTTNANLTGAVTSVGNATSLGSFTSANLSGALTDETGTGAAVFAVSPALTGTPSAPTAIAGTNTTQLATTAFVTTAVTNSFNSIADLTNGAGIASFTYDGSSAQTVALANGTAAGQVYVTGATPFTPALVTMGGDAVISSAGAVTIQNAAGNNIVAAINNGLTTNRITVDKINKGTVNQVLLTPSPLADPVWGLIANANIDAAAGIVDTKLATISTAGKVANSATSATSANTPSTIVLRDASGNFSAGTITANLTGNVTGNASTATALQTARTINGVSFDGTADITLPTWDRAGNAITTGQFIGTTNSQDLVFKVNNQEAGRLNEVLDNYSFGQGALSSSPTGGANVAFGQNSLQKNTSAHSNSGFGYGTLTNNTTGLYNTALGAWALYGNLSGSHNTAVGSGALWLDPTGITTGDDNTALGYNANVNAGNLNNVIVIGSGAIATASNQTMIGNSSSSSVYLKGANTVTTANAPNMYVDANGQIMASTATVVTAEVDPKVATVTNNVYARWNSSTSKLVDGIIVENGSANGIIINGYTQAQAIFPNGNNIYDLGTTSNRWRDLFVSGNSIHLGASAADEVNISYFSGIMSINKPAQITGNLLPATDVTYDLGSTGQKWNNVYAATFNGALSGNATTATTATNFSGSLVGDVTGTQGATVIANNAVTTGKIANGTILPEDLSTQTTTPWAFAAPVNVNNTLNALSTITVDGINPRVVSSSGMDFYIIAGGGGRVTIGDDFAVMGLQTGLYENPPASNSWSIGYTISGTGNLNLKGDFSFDAGQTVDGIVTSIGSPGLNTNLPTEKAVRDAITSAGTGYQPLDADLTGLAALNSTTTANQLVASSGTANGYSLLSAPTTSGQVLTYNGSNVAWASPAGSSTTFSTITGNTTLSSSVNVYLVNNTTNITLTLPAASGNSGLKFIIKKVANNNTADVIIDPNGSELVDGITTLSWKTQWQGFEIACDGTAWYIISKF